PCCPPSAPRSRSTTSAWSRWRPRSRAPARPTCSWSWRRSSTPPCTSASHATWPTTWSSRRSRVRRCLPSSRGCTRRSCGTWSRPRAGPAPPRCTSSNRAGCGPSCPRRSGPRSGGPSSSASSSRSASRASPKSSASAASGLRLERRGRVGAERLVEGGLVARPELGVPGSRRDHVPVVVLRAHPVLGRDRAVAVLVVQVLPLIHLEEHVAAASRPVDFAQRFGVRDADVDDPGEALVLDQQLPGSLGERQCVVMRLASEELRVLLHLDVLGLQLAVDRIERDGQRGELQGRPEPLRSGSE